MAGEKRPKLEKTPALKAGWTAEKVEQELSGIPSEKVAEISRRAEEAAGQLAEQKQKSEALFRHGEEVMKESGLMRMTLEIGDLRRSLLDPKLSQTRRLKTERAIRKLQKEKELLRGPVPEEKPIPPFSEELALELLRAEDQEALLKKMAEDSRISASHKETLEKVLPKLEGVFDFDARANLLLEMQRTEALPDEVFYSLASALLQEDQEGVPPIEVFRVFVRKAEALLQKYEGKEIPAGELSKLQEEVESLGRAKTRFFKAKFGSRVLSNVEKPVSEKADLSRVLKILEVMFGEDERKVLEDTARAYEVLNKEAGFITSARSGTEPSYGPQGQFEIAMRMREWKGEQQGLPLAQYQEYSALLNRLEEFLIRSGAPEIRQYILQSQGRDRREVAFRKVADGILRVNTELAITFGTAEPSRFQEISQKQKESIKRAFKDLVYDIKQEQSLPLLEPLLKRLLYLDDLLRRLEAGSTEVSGEERIEVSPEKLEREALALAREFEARDRLAHVADLEDALLAARNPREERKIRDRIMEKQREAEDLFKRAEQIRRGEQ